MLMLWLVQDEILAAIGTRASQVNILRVSMGTLSYWPSGSHQSMGLLKNIWI